MTGFSIYFSIFVRNEVIMINLNFNVRDEDHKRFLGVKYSFILDGEFTISNGEIMRRLLDCYLETHRDEMKEMPDTVYRNYLKKGQRAEKKKAETRKRNARKQKEE